MKKNKVLICIILFTSLFIVLYGCISGPVKESVQPPRKEVKIGLSPEEVKSLKPGDYLKVPSGYYKVMSIDETSVQLSNLFQKGKTAQGSTSFEFNELPALIDLDTVVLINPFRPGEALPEKTGMEKLQRAFVDLRFGMFIHFGILTYTGTWSQPNLNISLFNPYELDCSQWAGAAKAAGMTFGVLTTKHHDGFALWDSSMSTFDVASIPWRNGKGDVVAEFVDAFREEGLLAGLYYSIWDTTNNIGRGKITRKQIDYVKQELRELLTNYGPINVLIVDGWSWLMGHRAMPYGEIREFIRELQPQCLVIDHTHLECHYDNDIFVFEEPKGVFSPKGNTLAAAQDQKIIDGNDWFWGENTEFGIPLNVSNIVKHHLIRLEQRYTTFILNCPPNRKGLIDDQIVDVLRKVGETWKPDMNRAPLPKQPPFNLHPITPQKAYATTGNAGNAIDGKNDANFYSIWKSGKGLPQSITIDFGQVYDNMGILCYVPQYKVKAHPTTDGAITSYRIYASIDGEEFSPVSEGNWPLDTTMKIAQFPPIEARYLRLEAIEANMDYAAATEITAGLVF